MHIFFVPEDQELASGHTSNTGGYNDPFFRNLLEAAGTKNHQTIHIEFILMSDGDANNPPWLSAPLAREYNCQGFNFWNVGTSYLLSGGSASDLFKNTKKVESYRAEMEV